MFLVFYHTKRHRPIPLVLVRIRAKNTERMSQKNINLLDYIRTNISGGLVVNKKTNKL